MKNLFIIVSLILSVSIKAQFGGNAAPTPIVIVANEEVPPVSDIAIVHYGFNDNANDDSGNGYDASETNMSYDATSPAEGSHSGSFVSTSTLFVIPSAVTWGSTFSVSLWARQDFAVGYYEFLSPYKTNGDYEYWRWWLDGPQGDIEFRGYQNSTNTLDNAYSQSSAWTPSYTWVHYGMTYDNGTVQFFINGSPITMNNTTTWGTSDMKIDHVTMAIAQYFAGEIDDFSMYDQVLSNAKFVELYNGGTAGTVLTSF